MPVTTESLMGVQIPEVRHTLTERDTMLYALSVGLGQDPMDENQLCFVTEPRLAAFPTIGVVLAYPGFWIRDLKTGIDFVKLVHGEQGLTIHRPLPAKGEIIGRTRVTGVVDKGAGKGMLLYSRREMFDAASGALIATADITTFCRGDGGFGGPAGPVKPVHPLPERAPDRSLDLPTRPEQALYYRLSGDYNPLHSDPAVAAKAGFPRPILHGLCTFGVCGHALMKLMCDYDPARFGAMDVRFSAPVYPGETIRTEVWDEPGGAAFRALAVERNVVVINNGRFRFA
ncbi:MAG: MaoC family dehydratase N-terminal domain-containing protein [Alphaproteobacteria bacterium]|nr:MaoC family dehydratase N-terminal domain-containing protein [Alphaproteobacteria bacterium]